MRWPTLVAAVALTTVTIGCDRIPFIGGDDPDTQTALPPDTTADTTATDTTQIASEQEAAPALEQEPASRPTSQPAVRRPSPAVVDAPWTPTASGTVDPGMDREQVVAAWGAPAAERTMGEWHYLYYRNGCERTCGTFDIVFLQGGQVVDAVVRWSGHVYTGISSSPPGRVGEFTPPTGGIGSAQ